MPSLTNGTRATRPSFTERIPTFPSYYSSRKKPRRWPLVLRFIKGAIHIDIALPVIGHALFSTAICYFDSYHGGHLAIPSTTLPSLSIVVGLMLVFRNSTSYDRFWQGNQLFTQVETNIRNLVRSFLACSYALHGPPPSDAERADTERTVRITLALIYAAKNHLRAEWGHAIPILGLPSTASTRRSERERRESVSVFKPEYDHLLPSGTRGHEEHGLGLVLQLSIQVEAYIKRAHDRGWFHAPQASQLTVQLNSLVAAYGSMETIHLTPLPVAYLIHMRQVLALFCGVLPFALVSEMGWWSILMVSFIAFTLYGIEAIGAQLEDPFGYDRNDIKLDNIVEDLRTEVTVLLENWKRDGDLFKQHTSAPRQ
ncbi:60S ribosomal L32 [Lecanosticta acicola]|uniref:60S ribosomal L32 n=1 Tax=Lecanosticta acicola TaxID=111012 RepID=A0AAI8Z7U8_9PEZI|nr:60S ribosomal L32 [Lecanosticta acicola]